MLFFFTCLSVALVCTHPLPVPWRYGTNTNTVTLLVTCIVPNVVKRREISVFIMVTWPPVFVQSVGGFLSEAQNRFSPSFKMHFSHFGCFQMYFNRMEGFSQSDDSLKCPVTAELCQWFLKWNCFIWCLVLVLIPWSVSYRQKEGVCCW